MINDQFRKDDPPTYEEATSGSLPPPRFQPSMVSPPPQASQEPDHRQTGAYHIPYSHIDDSLYVPAGLLPLGSMHLLTVSNKSASVYKIKDISKQLVFTAKVSAMGDCCTCCDDTASWTEITIRTLDKQPLALCKVTIDEMTCCSEPQRSIAVSFPHAGAIGCVTRKEYYYFDVKNPRGDTVLTIQGKSGFWSNKPFKIFALDGSQIGSIERTDGVKNRLIFPTDLDIRYKILLLATAIHIQELEAQRRRRD